MKLKTAVLILMLAAAIFLTIPLVSIIKSVKIKKLGVTTESTVLKTVRRSSKGSGLRDVTVSFSTSDGSQVTSMARKRKYVIDGEKVMIWYDPADPVPYLNGRYPIDVFIDPSDPGKYYMDTSFMPKGNNTIG